MEIAFRGVQEVRWNKGGTVIVGDCVFSMEDKTKIIGWERGICGPQNFISS
jgi:hypothetical protein